MRLKGITYDTGIISAGTTTREPFDPEVVQREMRIIRDDLNCNAVRVTGGVPKRLEIAARHAANAGLEVWFSPFTNELTVEEVLAVLADCAERAERLRQASAGVVFVTGAELSLFTIGLLPGATSMDRIQALIRPTQDLREVILKMRAGMNDLLGKAVALVRERFGGKITYASIHFEGVDWTPFDFIATDSYRTVEIAEHYPEGIRALVRQGKAAGGKPVAITEFGCATFHGAAALGARAGMIVEWDGARAGRLNGDYTRDEEEQAREIGELLDIYEGEGVDAVFLNTFASYHLPHRTSSRDDMDMAGFGIVKVFEAGRGQSYPDMPWEPKAAFAAVAAYYRG
jgi:hypothetical protein